jgi:hypothetical protein
VKFNEQFPTGIVDRSRRCTMTSAMPHKTVGASWGVNAYFDKGRLDLVGWCTGTKLNRSVDFKIAVSGHRFDDILVELFAHGNFSA